MNKNKIELPDNLKEIKEINTNVLNSDGELLIKEIEKTKQLQQEIEKLNNNWELLKEYIKQLPSNEYIGYWKYDILEDIDKIKENSNER